MEHRMHFKTSMTRVYGNKKKIAGGREGKSRCYMLLAGMITLYVKFLVQIKFINLGLLISEMFSCLFVFEIEKSQVEQPIQEM